MSHTDAWLLRHECPVLGTFRAGEKGHFKVPEHILICGIEMYIFGTLRHCKDFPASAKCRAFCTWYDIAPIFMLPQFGLPGLDLTPLQPMEPEVYLWLSKAMAWAARHFFKPGEGQVWRGEEGVRTSDGLIRWSASQASLRPNSPASNVVPSKALKTTEKHFCM